MNREPAVIRAAITAVVVAIVHALIVFGVPIPADVADGIAAAVDALGGIVATVWIRSVVTPAKDPVVPADATLPAAPAVPAVPAVPAEAPAAASAPVASDPH